MNNKLNKLIDWLESNSFTGEASELRKLAVPLVGIEWDEDTEDDPTEVPGDDTYRIHRVLKEQRDAYFQDYESIIPKVKIFPAPIKFLDNNMNIPAMDFDPIYGPSATMEDCLESSILDFFSNRIEAAFDAHQVMERKKSFFLSREISKRGTSRIMQTLSEISMTLYTQVTKVAEWLFDICRKTPADQISIIWGVAGQQQHDEITPPTPKWSLHDIFHVFEAIADHKRYGKYGDIFDKVIAAVRKLQELQDYLEKMSPDFQEPYLKTMQRVTPEVWEDDTHGSLFAALLTNQLPEEYYSDSEMADHINMVEQRVREAMKALEGYVIAAP